MRTITIPGDPVEEDKDKDEELTIGKRFLMSFGDKGTIQKLKSMEEEAGLRGKLDWGDLADVAGGMFPFAGGMLGAGGGTAFGPVVGSAIGIGIGTAAGESLKRAIGIYLGVRPSETRASAAYGPLVSGVAAAGTAKAVEWGARAVKAAAKPTIGYIFSERGMHTLKVADAAKQKLKLLVEEGVGADDISKMMVKSADDFSDESFKAYQKALTGLDKEKMIGRDPVVGNVIRTIRKGFDLSPEQKIDDVAELWPSEDKASFQKLMTFIGKKWDDFSERGVYRLRKTMDSSTPDFNTPYGKAFSEARESLNFMIGESNEEYRKALGESANNIKFLQQLGFVTSSTAE